MKERPILFKGEMVNAILPGWKTKTRRIVKQKTLDMLDAAAKTGECMDLGSPIQDWDYVASFCPYGKPGDRLWVRETMIAKQPENHRQPHMMAYAADGKWVEPGTTAYKKSVPSIHMPRWASRILLEITDVRVERLQDISEEDAKAEGVSLDVPIGSIPAYQKSPYVYSFASLWESINGPESWNENPWVWVVEFKRVEQ